MAIRFRYKFFLPKTIYVFILTIIPIFIGIFGTRRDGFSISGLILVLFTSLFFGFFTVLGALFESDIVIDDQGISRSLFGKIWRTIKWRDVRKIRVVSSTNPAYYNNKKLDRAIFIDTSDKPRSFCLPTGSIVFSDRAENIQELVELINRHVLKYNIQVEVATSAAKGLPQKMEKIVL